MIASDGVGYYHYLTDYFFPSHPATQSPDAEYLVRTDQGRYNKYPVGVALLLLPFFLLAFLWSGLAGLEPDPFSFPFQLATGLAALFYLFLGAVFLYRLLLSYGSSGALAYGIVLTAVFGSNLLYYGLIASSMSHVYSFFALSGFALSMRQFLLKGEGPLLLVSSIFLALVLLLRPANSLVVLCIPLLAGNSYVLSAAYTKVLRSGAYLWLALGLGILMLGLQLLIWRHQSGEWLLYSYAHEGFYFQDPRWRELLFGFNKGLFVYTPLAAVPVICAVYGSLRGKLWAWSFMLFFLALTYVLSSWWCWNFASGFGMRPFIDFYGIFCIPVVLVLMPLGRSYMRYLLLPLAILVAFNCLQTYQYRVGILHPNSMNAEKYRYVFLKTHRDYRQVLGGSFDLPPYPRGHLNLHSDWLHSDAFVSAADPFLFTEEVEAGSIHSDSPWVYWKLKLDASDEAPGASSSLFFVVTYSIGDSSSFYHAFPVNDLPEPEVGHRLERRHSLRSRAPTHEESVKVYLWNQSPGPIRFFHYHLGLWVIQRP